MRRRLPALVLLLLVPCSCIEPPASTNQTSADIAPSEVGIDATTLDRGTALADFAVAADLSAFDVSTTDSSLVDQDMGPNPDTGPILRETLFVLGDAAFISPSDSFVINMLAASNHKVSVIDDDLIATVDPDAFDLVVVSKTSSGDALGSSLRATTTGVLTWESRLQYVDRLSLIATTTLAFLSWAGIATTVVVDPPSRLQTAVGLSGTIDLYRAGSTVWYVPQSELGSGAEVIARLTSDSPGVFSYVYDRNAVLADGEPAPARRAYIGLDQFGVETLTVDGRRLLMALVNWTLR